MFFLALMAATAFQVQSTPTAAELVALAVEHVHEVRQASNDYAVTSDGYIDNKTIFKGQKQERKSNSHGEGVYIDGNYYATNFSFGHKFSAEELEQLRRSTDENRKRYEQRHSAAGLPQTNTFDLALSSGYTATIEGHETVDGHDCLVVVANPKVVGPDPRETPGFTYWLDNTTKDLVRMRQELLADRPFGDIPSVLGVNGKEMPGSHSEMVELKGSSYTYTYRPVNGVWLGYESRTFNMWHNPVDGMTGTIETVTTTTKYQRFSVDVDVQNELPAETPKQ